jgi:hypothetical protein
VLGDSERKIMGVALVSESDVNVCESDVMIVL